MFCSLIVTLLFSNNRAAYLGSGDLHVWLLQCISSGFYFSAGWPSGFAVAMQQIKETIASTASDWSPYQLIEMTHYQLIEDGSYTNSPKVAYTSMVREHLMKVIQKNVVLKML